MPHELKELPNDYKIKDTFSYGIVYIYSIPLETHAGRLKIGGATINSLNPTQKEINLAAEDRIRQQTTTADIPWKLEHAELAVTKRGEYFSDRDVHKVLERSGYGRKAKSVRNSRSEWFEVDLGVAQIAIDAVKKGREALKTSEKKPAANAPFPFRPNQLDAIKKTTNAIKKNRKHFLWNAKMRFGKTSAAMQVARENQMQKVLIVTHRPSVSVDWYDDFNKVFAGTNYQYSSKTKGENIGTLIRRNEPFVYFASLQDLRLSKRVVDDAAAGSKAKGFEKNDEVFDTTWDMLIVDEAHEGTQSSLGDTTFSKMQVNFTLQLSGTPFNILHKHEEKDIYTWDYVMEQEEKLNWDERHPGAPNPYAELPALNMCTYDIDTFSIHLGGFGGNFRDSLDGAFKFHEFFRVQKDDEGNDIAKFVHESMVKKFLGLLVDGSIETKFPYATEDYRNYNKHALWLLPNRVKVIEAMETLLKNHSVFGAGNFGIVNISGNNYDDGEDKDAKDRVTSAIKKYDYTITLTGQRLTTGASIKEWTAVLMMSDTNSATSYLQTAFRCQTPAKIDGKLKTLGYVFDFAPDRTLRLVAEAIELNHKSGKTNTLEQKNAMDQFLNFCPILAAEGGSMKPYDVGSMLGQLKKAIIERVSRNGFDDPKLYNERLLRLKEVDIRKFNDLKKIVGSSTTKKVNAIKVNGHGLDGSLIEDAEQAERKKQRELTSEEKEALRNLKEARKQRESAVSILRAVSIRMPLLVFGANVSIRQDITLEKFIEVVDDESWHEFMPEGLTKEKFKEFAKFYDEDVFRGVTRSIRAKAYDCDALLPVERVQAIADLFSTFKNPDKETVLTPWDVVNKHLTFAFGGHDFSSGVSDKHNKPEWKSKDVNTSIWEKDDTKILEINSKSGLYPLLSAYNVYSRQLKKHKKKIKSEESAHKNLWALVLENNIYVLCKSPMAKSITERTLVGYSKNIKTNVAYIDDLVKKLQKKDEFKNFDVGAELLKIFELSDNMKFTAIVGNPPYQTQKGGTKNIDIWQHFVFFATRISENAAFVHPARWVAPKKQMRKVRDEMVESGLQRFDYYPDAKKLFPTVAIDGGLSITVFNEKHSGTIKYSIEGNSFGIYAKTSRFISNKFEQEIIEKFEPLLINGETMLERIVGNIGSLGGSEYGYSKAKHRTELRKSPKGITNFVKVWANDSLGRGGRFSWFYVSKESLNNIPRELLLSRKVMLDKKGNAIAGTKGNILNNIPMIVEKEAIASGDVLFVLPEQDTDHDLELIRSLFLTKTARFLMSITQKDLYVRGFDNIPDYILFKNELNEGLFSDDWFYERYEFSDELVNHIESSISSKSL